MDDARQEVRRLERRVARERAARIEAETIAESGTRELYERERRLGLMVQIAIDANESVAIGPTVAQALARVCEFTGWPVGHLFVVRPRRGRPSLTSARLWQVAEGMKLDLFDAASRRARFEPGQGLPGRAFASRRPVWIADIGTDGDFVRVAEARASGLQAAFAIPIMAGGEVVAVMEFFSDHPTPPDQALLETLEGVGAQLGRVFERALAERALRRRNAALRAAIREAEAASRAKSLFLAATSHEIRTPLNAILGLAYALAREPLSAGQRELVEGVTDAGAMLLRLLNGVLDISRIERGEQSLELACFDLRRSLEALLRAWRARADELGLTIELDVTALPRSCVVQTDQGKLEQTLVNLLSNAMKFTPAGGRVRIAAALAEAGAGRGRVRIEVVDQGPGVPQAQRARIFEAFEQTDEGRKAGGMGLGLAICSGAMAALGGAIGQDDTDEGENRFWVEFETELGGEVPANEAAAGPVSALRVLAAEDNAANRHVLKVLLDPFDVQLTFAEDGLAAVEATRAEAFDVVLMDANMPRMDGVEALKRIRAGDGPCAAAPIYMLTANVFEEDIGRYLAAGADGVLRKPIDVGQLLGVLTTAGDQADCRAKVSVSFAREAS